MGQHQNKSGLTKDYFEAAYEENVSHEYFTHTKSFGYRKTNIKSTNLQKISPLVKDSSYIMEEVAGGEKPILKKQFQSSTYPYSCIGLIIVSYEDRCVIGSGCLIGPSLVLTAASNVYHKDTDQHPQMIRFVLGINQNEGDVYLIKPDISIPDKYMQEINGSHRFNYALLEIEGQEHLTDRRNAELDNKQVKNTNEYTFPGLVYGYLGINTRFSGMENIYIYGCSIERTVKSEMKFAIRGEKIDKLMCKYGSIGYKMDSSQSESGSPILIRRNEYFHIVGIHICGKKGLGSGLQFDEDMRKTINSWITVKEGRMNLSEKAIDSKAMSLLVSRDWQYLTILNLDNNHLMSAGLIVLTKESWPVLRELHVCNNEIAKLEFETGSIQNLQVFYLTKNQIKDICILSELAILRVLELSENRVENIEDLVHLKYLERLYLNGNKLTKIPVEIEKLGELKKLELSRNELQSIPCEIGKLKNLSAISLDGNISKFEQAEVKKQLERNNVEVILD